MIISISKDDLPELNATYVQEKAFSSCCCPENQCYELRKLDE
tara:strand:+ start:15219 stop:15344 length:126 start_codon:yes stop_codon:yes gene_type:complete